MIELLDWSGTILIIIASVLLTTKKAAKPNVRLKVFLFFLGSNIIWIPMAIILGTNGFLLTQCFLLVINIKGIINCKKEMRFNDN